MSRSRGALLLAITVVVATVAGCTSSGSGDTSTPPASPPLSPAATTPTGAPPSVATFSKVPSTKRSTTSSTPRTSSSSAPPEAAGCPTDDLGIHVLRGGGVTGHEYALIMFTNQSSETCALTGFPGVSLRASGRLLGHPATRTTKAFQPVNLTPGATAQANLVVSTTCQATVSQTVRVYPPNQKTFVDLPLRVRGCSSTIDPVVPA